MIGNVYFVQSPMGGPIKIGFTKNLVARIENLRAQTAGELELLAAVPASQDDERFVHALMHHLRIHHEWFRASDELLSYIARAKDINAIPRPLIKGKSRVVRTNWNRKRQSSRRDGSVA